MVEDGKLRVFMFKGYFLDFRDFFMSHLSINNKNIIHCMYQELSVLHTKKGVWFFQTVTSWGRYFYQLYSTVKKSSTELVSGEVTVKPREADTIVLTTLSLT